MQSQTTYFQVLIGIMNELQVIGSLRLRKDFWIATEQTLQLLNQKWVRVLSIQGLHEILFKQP